MLSSAAHAGERVMYQEITDNQPDVGVSTTLYLGDRMLDQRRGQFLFRKVPDARISPDLRTAVSYAAT